MVKQLIVYRTTTQFVRYITPAGVILWTHDPDRALVMSCAKATALADRLQRSAGMDGDQYQPAGEYGVQRI